MSKKRHSTIGMTFEIDQAANKLLKSFLPNSWLIRDQKPDVYIDYHIEPVKNGEPQGFEFAVQLKGTQGQQKSKKALSYSMKRKHLLYYKECLRLPVFIVLANIETGAAYWLFIQQYLQEHAAKANLNSLNTFTIHFDPKNNLDDFSRFEKAVTHSEQFMRDLYPGSIAAAALNRKNFLQQLDPRIDVEISYENGREILRLNPKEQVSLAIHCGTPEASEAFDSLVKNGNPITLPAQLTRLEGSPLLDKLLNEEKIRIQIKGPSKSGYVQIAVNTPNCMGVLQCGGHWRGGAETFTFETDTNENPLIMKTIFRRSGWATAVKADISVTFNPDIWTGKPLDQLPGFDDVQAIYKTYAQGKEINLTYAIDGVKAMVGTSSVNNVSSLTATDEFLDLLCRVQFLLTHYKISAPMPSLDYFTDEKYTEINTLFALTNGNSFITALEWPSFTLSCHSDTNLPYREPAINSTPSSLKFSAGPPATFDLFGHPIAIENLEQIFTMVALTHKSVESGQYHLTFKACRDSQRILRRVS